MTGRIFSSTRAIAAALLAALAGAAHATPGNGIRLGGSDGRLHPFLDLETRYDSNVSYVDDAQAPAPTDPTAPRSTRPVGDLVLHVRPGLEAKVPGDLAMVEFSGALDWAQYLGVEGDTTNLSRMFADAKLAVLFNPRQAVSVRVDDDYARAVSSTSLAIGAAAVVSDSNVLTVAVPVRPGGGALMVKGAARWLVESFSKYQASDEVDVSRLGYNQLRADLDAEWKFLPRTSTVLELGYFVRNPSDALRDNTTGFDVLTGMQGLLTQHVGATAKLGWASSSYRDPNSPDTKVSKTSGSVIADLGLEWLPLENLSLRVGYARSEGIDPVAAVYLSDRVSGGAKVRLAQRIALRAGASWDRLSFDARAGAEASYLRVDPSVEALVGKWLTVSGGYTYSSRTGSGTSPVVGVSAAPDYSKNEVYLKAGFTY